MNINLIFAFSLTVFSALCAVIGGIFGVTYKQNNTNKFLSLALGFSSGIMLYLSFIEILGEGRELLTGSQGQMKGEVYVLLSFFGGMFVVALLDKLLPENESCEIGDGQSCLLQTGIISAIAVGIHNVPEGFAIFASGLESMKIGIATAVALGIHNLAIGMAISIPIYLATKNKKKAIAFTSVSALLSPIGAILGYVLFGKFINDTLFGIILSAVAGIMIYISLDEVLPTAEKYGEHHHVIYGIIGGMAVIALTILVLG